MGLQSCTAARYGAQGVVCPVIAERAGVKKRRDLSRAAPGQLPEEGTQFPGASLPGLHQHSSKEFEKFGFRRKTVGCSIQNTAV